MTPELATAEDKCLAVNNIVELELMNGLKFEDAAEKVAKALEIKVVSVYLACALVNPR
jgi:hypothetical protein